MSSITSPGDGAGGWAQQPAANGHKRALSLADGETPSNNTFESPEDKTMPDKRRKKRRSNRTSLESEIPDSTLEGPDNETEETESLQGSEHFEDSSHMAFHEREDFEVHDHGPGYPSALPRAFPGLSADSTVFPLARRPVSQVPDKQNTIGPNLSKESWCIGEPYPAGFGAWPFERCGRYIEAPVDREQRKAIITGYLAKHAISATGKVQSISTQNVTPGLRGGVEFLRPVNAHQSSPFMAGLLGFPSTGAYAAFMDLDVARFVAPARLALFISTESRILAMAKFPIAMDAMSAIGKTDGKVVATLQRTTACIVLEQADGIPVARLGPDMRIDKAATLFVLMYRLITFFPVRFPDREKPSQAAVFGFHPNAWSAAYLLLAAFKSRRGKNRGKSPNVPRFPRAGTKPGLPFRLGSVFLQESDDHFEPEAQPREAPARLEDACSSEAICRQNAEIEQRMGDTVNVYQEGVYGDGEASTKVIKHALANADPDFVKQLLRKNKLADKGGMLIRLIRDAFDLVMDQSFQYKGQDLPSQSQQSLLLELPPLSDTGTDDLIQLLRIYAGTRVDFPAQAPDLTKVLLRQNTGDEERVRADATTEVPATVATAAKTVELEGSTDIIKLTKQNVTHLLETLGSNGGQGAYNMNNNGTAQKDTSS